MYKSSKEIWGSKVQGMLEMTMKPIRPSELVATRLEQIPESVINCWNNIIAEKWEPNAKRSLVFQDDIIAVLLEKHPNIERSDIFDKHWLDIEDIYRAQGWLVKYDKPHYTENYKANFEFRVNPALC